jgi:ORF6N domain
MIDADFAELYGVSTKRLNEQVARNRTRFPKTPCFSSRRERPFEVAIWDLKSTRRPTDTALGLHRAGARLCTGTTLLTAGAVAQAETS